MISSKEDILQQSVKELRDIAYDLKTNQIIQGLEAKHLKQSVDDLKTVLNKEIEKREKKEQENKMNQTAVKVAAITGSLGFLTAIIVAAINFFKG